MKLIIDTEELTKLKDQAGKITLEPEAESTLARILELEGQIAEIKEAAKLRLFQEGRNLNPNFKSWEADSIKVSMRAYGAKYFVSEGDIDLAPKELFKTEVTVAAPNVSVGELVETLQAAGFPVAVSKGKDGKERLDIKRSVDTKAVDKWIKQHGLPTGIEEFKERPVSLSFDFKKVKEEVV